MQFEIQVSVVTESGEKTIDGDENNSFDDICNKIEEKISKWQEYYVLIDNDTRKEITTNKIFDETIEKVQKESRATSVLFLCQAKYTFHVRDETDSKENEFSLPYFPLSMDTFEKFLKKITENCVKWEDSHQIVHNAPNNRKDVIENDISFRRMIENCKYQRKKHIRISLKLRVRLFPLVFCLL